MVAPIDLTHQRFGKLFVIAKTDMKKRLSGLQFPSKLMLKKKLRKKLNRKDLKGGRVRSQPPFPFYTKVVKYG